MTYLAFLTWTIFCGALAGSVVEFTLQNATGTLAILFTVRILSFTIFVAFLRRITKETYFIDYG
jgi:hypothetical protein